MKKLLYTLIFFVCILASFLITDKVFADTEIPVTIKGTTENITIPDCAITQKYNYFLCLSSFDNSNGTISVNCDFVVSTSDLVFIDVDTRDNVVFRCPNGVVYCSSFRSAETSVSKAFNTIQSKVNYFFDSFTEDDLLNSSLNSFSISKKFTNTSVANITNTIIKDEEGNVVFPQAPQEGAIATIAKSIDFSGVLAEVLKMLPIILIVLIGLIALMKAIKLLYSIFRNA